MTLVHILEWLSNIVDYGSAMHPELGGQVDWTKPLESGLYAVTAKSIVELKSLASPPRSAKLVVSAVNCILGYQPDWANCLKAMANKNQYLKEMASVKERMEKGEDFSKGLQEAKSIVDNPELDPENVRDSSRAAHELF